MLSKVLEFRVEWSQNNGIVAEDQSYADPLIGCLLSNSCNEARGVPTVLLDLDLRGFLTPYIFI